MTGEQRQSPGDGLSEGQRPEGLRPDKVGVVYQALCSAGMVEKLKGARCA